MLKRSAMQWPQWGSRDRRGGIDPWEASSGMALPQTVASPTPVCICCVEDLAAMDARDLSGRTLCLDLQHVVRDHHVASLIPWLQRADVRSVEVYMTLSAMIDVHALHALLAALDAHPSLTHLSLTVDGAPSEAMRRTLAASPVCMKCCATVRRILFAHLDRAFSGGNGHGLAALYAFIEGTPPFQPDAVDVLEARDALVALALRAQDEALLIALHHLSGLRPLVFVALPEPDGCQLLHRAGVAWGLDFTLKDGRDVQALCAWLDTRPQPPCRSIALRLTFRVDATHWARLSNLLMARVTRGQLQRLDMCLEVEDALPAVTDEAFAPTRLPLLYLDLSHDFPLDEQLDAIADLVVRFGPRRLLLSLAGAVTALALMERLASRGCQPLEETCLEWPADKSRWAAADGLEPLLAVYPGPGHLQVCWSNADAQPHHLVHMAQATEKNPLLNGYQILYGGCLRRQAEPEALNSVVPNPGGDVRFVDRRFGFMQKWRWQLGAQAFVQSLLARVGVDPNCATHVLQRGGFSWADLRAIAAASWEARRAGQAAAIVTAMGKGRLGPAHLRTLLLGSQGQPDRALIEDVRKRWAASDCGASAEIRSAYEDVLTTM